MACAIANLFNQQMVLSTPEPFHLGIGQHTSPSCHDARSAPTVPYTNSNWPVRILVVIFVLFVFSYFPSWQREENTDDEEQRGGEEQSGGGDCQYIDKLHCGLCSGD